MQHVSGEKSPASVKRKILAGFLLSFVAILLALGITHYAFRDMLGTVEALTAPNQKLVVLNQIFQEITTLDQQQRAEAIKNPRKPYAAFLNQSQTALRLIDSLLMMPWDPAQRNRMASMKDILQERNRLFFSYLRIKSNLVDNKSLTKRIDTLSTIIEQKKVEIDSSVITTQKKTVTTYTRDSVQEQQKGKSWLGRVFSKKKETPPPPKTQIKVQEELSVIVDTLAIARENKALEEVEKIVHDLETDQKVQSRQLVARELELIQANSLFINQLLGILHEVEREELSIMEARNDQASTLVNESIFRMGVVLVIFFLGAALMVYLIWVDISRSNYYKEQLEKARDEAFELSQIKQRFLANMSHEIRTPLQSIIGFSEQIKHTTTPDPQAIQAIHSSSEHLLHIVNEVLDYSRLSSGHFTFAREPFSLRDVVTEIESAMRIQASRKQLAFLVDYDGDDVLTGDAFRLRQILYNLLGNAIKFTSSGYVRLTVGLEADGERRICRFTITDTGIGIKAEDLKNIFNQFEQANSLIARQFGGTGLGLTIVKSLIEAQGGHLQVSSEPGQGSTFTVTIPYEVASQPVHTASSPAVAQVASAPAGKVLVVDDDATILRLCGLILSRHDVPHLMYNASEKLLEAPVDEAVTHILMDIRMPHVSGVDLCRALRPRYAPSVRFIALTAHVFEQEKQALRDEGFDVVLSKPFHEADLLATLGISMDIQQPTTEKQMAPVVDLTPLRQMTLGDEALFQSILQQFIEETESDLLRLPEPLSEGETAALREVVHKLAGRIGQIGATALSAQLRQIEKQLDAGEEQEVWITPLRTARAEVVNLLVFVQQAIVQPTI